MDAPAALGEIRASAMPTAMPTDASEEPQPWPPETRVYVFSHTLDPADHPGVTVSRDPSATVEALRAEPGNGEIWLFGGGELFRELAASGRVDRVELTYVPVLLGGGIPLIAPGAGRIGLTFEEMTRYPSGMVTLTYSL